MIALLFLVTLKAQDKHEIIELSGVVVSNDSTKQFVPYAHIYIKNRNQVLTTDDKGFFSFAALPNDTIVFSHISFMPEKLWVPDTLEKNQYLTMVSLTWDTTLLEPVILYPWPSRENFQSDFLAMRVEVTDYDIAQRNLAIQALKDRAAAMGYDAEEMGDYIVKVQNQNLYSQGRYYGADGGAAIVGALTNPFAWAEFFNALKRGDFKSK